MVMLRQPKSDDRDLLVRLDSVDVPLLPSEPGRKQINFPVEHEDQEFGNGLRPSDMADPESQWSPGVETAPPQEDEEDPVLLHAQFAQCSRFL